ncbi:MAG: enoyl-CoA hydratase/isomerase family protein [Chloroflexi bacterium]|nr:enoyl-CoA hydratase/isomerase family protein [Chloroflexota bacterium]
MDLKLVDYLLYEPEPETGILWIKFNRPERLNALLGVQGPDGSVFKLLEYMRAGDDDPNIRVMVVTGVGRAFCAGIDVRRGESQRSDAEARPQGPDANRQQFYHVTTPPFLEISRMVRKPTIAMVNGVAVGMGMDIALHCDIRIGCEHTRFLGYQTVGQIPENGALYHLPRLMGLGRALEFVYTGSLSAEDAYRTGVLNRLVPSEQLEAETRALCERIVKNPPLVQWISKRIMRAALDSSIETTMVMTSNVAGILATSEDGREARAAVAEKREPRFQGR